MRRMGRWVFGTIVTFGLIGCGGGGGLEEGMPSDVASQEAEFQKNFRGMMEQQAADMKKEAAAPKKPASGLPGT